MEKFSCSDHVVVGKIKMTNQKSFLNSFCMVSLCDFFVVLALWLIGVALVLVVKGWYPVPNCFPEHKLWLLSSSD